MNRQDPGLQHGRALAPVLALLTALATPLLASAEEHGGEHGGHAARVTATTPLRRDVTITHDYVSQIHANRHIEVRALERGYLESVEVTEGQTVQKGQLMFRIQPLTYQAEFRRARAEAEAARVEFENTRDLASGNVVSDTQLALARAKYERAQAEVSLAEAHLSFTEIHAPFGGIMDRLELREGSLVEEGELLTTLSDNSTMWVYFNVPEAEYLDYATDPLGIENRPVTLLMANGRQFAEPGHIAVIEADFNNRTGTIPFRADFANPTGLLRHGQTGKILLAKPIPGALLVPQKATFEILDQTYVYVLREGGQVQQRRIVIADELEDVFVVAEGLAGDEHIVLEGLRNVRDGAVVEYELEDPDSAFAHLKTHAE
jgi:membrane fusion protein (multidrug efflux system)